MNPEQRFIVGLSLGLCIGFLLIGATMRDPNSLFLAIVSAACFDSWRGVRS